MMNTFSNVYDYINKYELIAVTMAAKGVITNFYASGIKKYQNNEKNIGFKRLGSCEILPESVVTSAIIHDDGTAVIKCGETTYTLKPLKLRSTTKRSNIQKGVTLDYFMKPEMIEKSKVTTENNVVYLPIDTVAIEGDKQSTYIRIMLDRFLDGQQEKYQCCRMPAFSIEFKGNEYIINAHIRNVGSGEYLNTLEVFNSADDIHKIRPYDELVKFAREFIAA